MEYLKFATICHTSNFIPFSIFKSTSTDNNPTGSSLLPKSPNSPTQTKKPTYQRKNLDKVGFSIFCSELVILTDL